MCRNDVITHSDQITPAWLTDVLTRAGALSHGSVEALEEVGARVCDYSTNTRLLVRYADGAQGDLPQRLFLKIVKTRVGPVTMGPSEVYYYTRDYIGVPGFRLPRWYDAAYSEVLECYHVLMDDLTETHVDAISRQPTLAFGLALAEILAVMHAHWWGAERLATYGETLPTAQQIAHVVDNAKPGAAYIANHCSDRLFPHWPEVLHDIFARHPQALLNRTRDPRGYTLVHGDPNMHNILIPRVGDQPVYLIDRQPFLGGALTNLGINDLAYMMVLDWPTELRRRFEVAILRHYHDSLIRHGISDYSWERALLDYRLSIPNCVYVIAEWCHEDKMDACIPLWLPMLQNTLTACDDWKVQDLWSAS